MQNIQFTPCLHRKQRKALNNAERVGGALLGMEMCVSAGDNVLHVLKSDTVCIKTQQNGEAQ